MTLSVVDNFSKNSTEDKDTEADTLQAAAQPNVSARWLSYSGMTIRHIALLHYSKLIAGKVRYARSQIKLCPIRKCSDR